MAKKIFNAVIRKVNPDDYDALVHFFEENNSYKITRQFNPFPLNKNTARDIALREQLDHYYVALISNRIVGLCMLRGAGAGYSAPSFGILVGDGFQRRGLGRELSEYAIAQARLLGYNKVRLSVYASNKRAVRLYTSLGFSEVERQKTEVMGEPDEKIIMIKGISNNHE